MDYGTYWLEVKLIENGLTSDMKNVTFKYVDTDAKLGWMGHGSHGNSFQKLVRTYMSGADRGSTYDIIWSLTDEQGNIIFNKTDTKIATSPSWGISKYY